MEAIVLAGGLGTRLRGVVDNVPKPMAPVQGRPFLALVLDQLVAAGFKTVIFAAGYLHEAIRSYFGADYRGLVLRYSVEEEPLGTGGAIRLACEQADARDVFVLNGDTYLEFDFSAMMEGDVRAVWRPRSRRRHRAAISRKGTIRAGMDKRRNLSPRAGSARSPSASGSIFVRA